MYQDDWTGPSRARGPASDQTRVPSRAKAFPGPGLFHFRLRNPLLPNLSSSFSWPYRYIYTYLWVCVVRLRTRFSRLLSVPASTSAGTTKFRVFVRASNSTSKHRAGFKNTPLGLKSTVFSCVAASFKETIQGSHLCTLHSAMLHATHRFCAWICTGSHYLVC